MIQHLFSGMNVNSMSVNVNFNNPYPSQHTKNGMYNGNSFLPNMGNSNQLCIEQPKYVENEMLYKFKNISIDCDYKLSISEKYDISNKPEEECETLNNFYIVSDYAGEHGYVENIIGEITNRRKDNPPILTILDYEGVENKEIIDQMIFHTVLLGKHYKFDKFFMVLETSGTLEDGEPFTVTFSKEKGLFKKEVYSIRYK